MLPIIAAYLLKVFTGSMLLLAYYWAVLRNRRFHFYNRFYLLLAVAVSIVIPLLHLDWFTISGNDSGSGLLYMFYAGSAEVTVADGTLPAGWQQWTVVAMVSVTAVCLFSMGIRIVRLYRFKQHYPVDRTGEFDFINTDLPAAPFSFFRNIFWRSDISLEETAGQQILQHELAHVRQHHTWDKLFMQITLAFFWMNPVYWIIRRELFLIHEFIADEKAVGSNDARAFASMLLHARFGNSAFSPAQSFFYSPIKRRLIMLTTSKEPRFNYARRIIALPLLACIVLLFSFRLDTQTPATSAIQSFNRYNRGNTATDTIVVRDTSGKQPLLIVDGKETNFAELKSIHPEDISSISVLKDKSATEKYGAKGVNGVIEVVLKNPDDNKTGGTAILNTDHNPLLQGPLFPGGAESWKNYLEKNLRTDVLTRRHAPSGTYTVIVSFQVDGEGNVSKVKALNDPGYGTAEEAVRVIAESGKWQSATENGKNVTAVTKQSISFRIDG